MSLLVGRKSFKKLYLSHAYQQIELDLQSQLYTTINTHKGLICLQITTIQNQLNTLNISVPYGESLPRATTGQCIY